MDEYSIVGRDQKLGQILVKRELISIQQLAAALEVQAHRKLQGIKHLKLGEILIFTDQINLEKLHSALSGQTSKAMASQRNSLRLKKNTETKKRDAHKAKAKATDNSFAGKLKSFFKN